MNRPADEARQRARGIRDEALSRLAERDRASLEHLRGELAEMKAMLREQRDRIDALTSMVASLTAAPHAPSAASGPLPSTPRPLTAPKRAALERIAALRDQGLSFTAICEVFRQDGVPTLSGDGQWSKGTLWNLWRNHAHQLFHDEGA